MPSGWPSAEKLRRTRQTWPPAFWTGKRIATQTCLPASGYSARFAISARCYWVRMSLFIWTEERSEGRPMNQAHVKNTAIQELLSRRDVLSRLGTGLPGLALASLLAPHAAGAASARATYDVLPKSPHFAPRAKRVLLLYQNGGPSQMDLFDYKPELQRRDGE